MAQTSKLCLRNKSNEVTHAVYGCWGKGGGSERLQSFALEFDGGGATSTAKLPECALGITVYHRSILQLLVQQLKLQYESVEPANDPSEPVLNCLT